jgi:GR25 family glycosyltransferase involved in LPS biosynthesis
MASKINHCLIINLDSRNDLWESLEVFRAKMEESNIKYERISGIDYRNKDYVLNKMIVENRIDLNGSGFRSSKISFLGEIGCYLSHYKCWEYIVKNKLKNCLIVEDGIHILRDDFNNLAIDSNFDLVFVNEEMKKNNNGFVGYGTQGYIITYKCAEILLKACNILYMPIDLQMRHICNSNTISANVIEKPFVQRNHTRVSSIDMCMADTEDLNKKQSEFSIIQRILKNLIEKNMNLDDYV